MKAELFEVSAKTNANVPELFNRIAVCAFERKMLKLAASGNGPTAAIGKPGQPTKAASATTTSGAQQQSSSITVHGAAQDAEKKPKKKFC
jgi:hypothetical protein